MKSKKPKKERVTKNRTFKWFVGKQQPAEIYQSVEMKFSMVGGTDVSVEQAHPWVKCRDFLHDAVRSGITGAKSQIYGFCYDPTNKAFPKLRLDKTFMLISQQTIDDVKSYRDDLSKALSFIHYYEDLVGVVNSTIKKVPLCFCKDKTAYRHVWLFEGDVFWISAPYLVSMLTFLLRLGCKLPKVSHIISPEEVYKDIIDKYEKEWKEMTKEGKSFRKDNDVIYLQSCFRKLSKLVLLKDELKPIHGDGIFSLMNDPKVVIDDFHNKTGILSACTGTTWNEQFNNIVKGVLK